MLGKDNRDFRRNKENKALDGNFTEEMKKTKTV